MFTFTTIGLSVSPRRITDSCMGIPSGKSCWPAQSYENRTGRAMSGRRSTPIDAKRLADFLAKIEAYEAVLLQRQRDIENQIVVYHMEQKSAEVANTPQPVLQEMLNSHRANDATLSRFAPIDLTTLQVYEEFLHPSDDLNEPLPPESQALLDRFKAYAVWHPRLLQVRTQVLDTVWEPADVVFVVVCGPSGVGKSKLQRS